ncbi:MAG: RibD family protein [Chloroflexota bacterium]
MNRVDHARPRVTIHYAQTLDGRIATCTGHSQWISGEESLRLAHRLRAEHQAVMVGVGTILADNPHLNVRLVPGASPKRIIVDSTLRLPLEANALTDGLAETVVATTTRATRDRVGAVRALGAEVVVMSQAADGRVDLDHLLRYLASLGIASVLVEGGRGLITSTLRSRLVDRLVVCIAPKLVGSGIEAVGDLNIRYLDQAVTFRQASFTQLGADIIFDGQVQHDGAFGI